MCKCSAPKGAVSFQPPRAGFIFPSRGRFFGSVWELRVSIFHRVVGVSACSRSDSSRFRSASLCSKKLVAHLMLKSPLASLILPALLPVALSLGMALAAFNSDMTLVPLALVIGLASHWPAVGWFYETPIFAVHSLRAGRIGRRSMVLAARRPLYLVTDVYWTRLCGDGGVDLARPPTLALGRSVVIGQ